MNSSSEDFFEHMLIFFPTKKKEYLECRKDDYIGLDTMIIEDVFMPEVIKLLKKDEDIELLNRVFSYFEEVSLCKDEELLNTFSVTALEILGNDEQILATAQKYMGSKTKELQVEADRGLGRFV